MAIECTANFAGVERTSDVLPFGSAYTWMVWVQLTDAVSGGGKPFIQIEESGVGDDAILFNDNGTVVANCYNGVVGASSAATAISVGTWTHVALVREDSDTLWLYVDGVKSSAPATLDVSIRGTPTLMTIREVFGVGFAAGVSKVWTRELTTEEIRVESRRIMPALHLGDLYHATPLLKKEDLVDYGGQGRPWSQGFDWEQVFSFQGPPVGWGRSTARLVVPRAAVAVGLDVDPLLLGGML
jgi:hypothetical protein